MSEERCRFLDCALSWNRERQSEIMVRKLHGEGFRSSELDSNWEKSRMSFTRCSISAAQFLAVAKYYWPSFSLWKWPSIIFNEPIIAFNGFLNSCAAEAKATVFIDDKLFCRSSSSHWDMSRMVVITSWVEPMWSAWVKTCSLRLHSMLFFSGCLYTDVLLVLILK